MIVRALAIALLCAVLIPAHADEPKPRGIQFQRDLPNIPGKKIVTVVVEYPPGGKTPSHRHAPSAFIYAYVLSGSIRSKVDDGPARVYEEGEDFFEEPGAHHVVSENASKTRPAKMLAVFIVNAGEPLTTMDPK
ncbi:hypothetical protein DSM104443_00558 [Usitatibacter rugosus]|uniref:Cupin type-2 domain-containing protein n=1 Tax=Usitatibacter rugosus TaxID=2732067 RepID=A0A6M4GSR6_9PROT|nr:cupin domain-containing protein [Usitatibacter rugosus]QJR09514.1 hypothetical protein DSM104443_00558 [Usitatibacter rugosus]